MKSGERVRVRTEDKSEKVWARVVEVTTNTEMIDVTPDPELAALFGHKAVAREFMPGMTTIRLVLEVEQL